MVQEEKGGADDDDDILLFLCTGKLNRGGSEAGRWTEAEQEAENNVP